MSLDRKLLSAINTPEKVNQAWEAGVSDIHFEEPFTDHLYRFIIGYWNKSRRLSVPTLEMLRKERPGCVLYEDVEEESWWLVEEILKRGRRNDIQEILIEALNSIDNDTEPTKVLTTIRSQAYQAAEKSAPRYRRSDMSDIDARERRYDAREQGLEKGLPFGLPELDEHTGTLYPGELCIVGAYSGVGKTFLLSYVATHVRRMGFQPIIFTLEMDITDIEDKVDCMMSGVSYNRYTKQKLSDKEKCWLRLSREYAKEYYGPILIEKPVKGERTVANLVARARHSGSDLILIDQLSHMDPPKKGYPTQKMKYTDVLAELDDEIDNPAQGKLPCILAAQLNRESLDHSILRMNHFADAAEVERHSDFAIGLARNSEYQTNRMARMDVMKGRRGGEAAWDLNWNLVERTRIDEYGRVSR